jgi:hypothetical protein
MTTILFIDATECRHMTLIPGRYLNREQKGYLKRNEIMAEAGERAVIPGRERAFQ